MAMHSYDVEGRGRVVAALTVASLLIVWLLHIGLSTIDFKPQWWLSVPSFAGAYSALYWLFDRYIRRFGLLRTVGLVAVPDLGGQWIGEVKSSYADLGATTAVSVTVLQRWSRISIILETTQSRSRSVAATFLTVDVPCPELSYLYVNEPRGDAPDTMHMHRGTVILGATEDSLEGDYYTGRDRREIGTLKLWRGSLA